MPEERKVAYRYLLYAVMLDARRLRIRILSVREVLNPGYWLHRRRSIQVVGEIGEWLHNNMALYASCDFDGFDELRFWEQASYRAVAFPELHHYKLLFDCRLFESVHGRWPQPGEFPNAPDSSRLPQPEGK